LKSSPIFIKRLLNAIQANLESIAVVDHDGQRQTTYRQLYTMACQVAGYLQQKEFPIHSFIGICLPSGLEYIAAEIGVWLAGHAIVPMGYNFPKKRIEYIMQHSESPLLIDEDIFRETEKAAAIDPVIFLDQDDIIALLYTSGSTGHPKGVIHTSRSYDFSHYLLKTLQEVKPLVMGMVLPMHFVLSQSMLAVLAVGGKVVVAPSDTTKDIKLLEDFFVRHKVTYAFLVAPMFKLFKHPAPELQLVMVGAERISDVSSKDYRLVDIYAQTETGGDCFSFEIDKAYKDSVIGRPTIENLEYKILDDQQQEVAQGSEGELCMRGPFSPGYYKAPEHTAALWKGGWFHTGDIVRELPNGAVVFVNRKDWMLKINGQRVEPGEVEIVMKEMNGIVDAIVKGFSTPDSQYLCAYYISEEFLTEDTIRKYLQSRLPAYMIPAYFIRMNSFPLLPNGKTNRKLLKSPRQESDLIMHHSFIVPQNDVEQQLCAAFEKTLSISYVNPDDDFFTLGGDSIRVMQIQTLCPNLPLSARMIYMYGTPKKIAHACSTVKVYPTEIRTDYPLTQSQLGIYLESMVREGKAVYNNGMLFLLDSVVDVKQLAVAVEKVIAAHPFVKTRIFVNSEGIPRQRRNNDEPYHLVVETMSESQFESLKPLLIQPFNLLRDSLFRIRIIKTPNNSYLFIDFHHIIFDGKSLDIFLSDLYRAYCNEPLEAEVFSGFEISLEEERLRNTTSFSQARESYKAVFGSLDINSLPRPDLSRKDIAFDHQDLVLNVKEHQLLDVCRYLDVTPNVMMISAFGCMLGAYNYSTESLFATIYHGRQDLKVKYSMMMMVKTMPVYMKWDGNTTVSGLLHATKQQLLDNMGNDLFSFAEMKALNHNINSNVLFAYQGDLNTNDIIDNMPLMQIPLEENATGEMLAYEVNRHNGQFTISAEYQSNLYSSFFIERMMRCFDQILNNFVQINDVRAPLCKQSFISLSEQNMLLKQGTGKSLNYDPSETFITLFRRQVKLTPEATAVVDECSTITYAELDRQSDILASALVKAGVIKESFVALLLPRRKEFLVAILAVFKAGGAYVSLDSEYPRQRLEFMLDDLGAHYLLTTSDLMDVINFKEKYTNGGLFLLDQFDFSVNSFSVDNSLPRSLAYVIYTSGTSGVPKGVMVEHRALCSMLHWVVPMEGIKAGDRCAQHASFSFDASLVDLFAPLTCGAEVYILSSTARYDLGVVSEYLTTHHITGLTMSTQVGMELLNNYDLKLRYLFMGGEKFHTTRNTTVRQINGYGPTEFTVCSSYHVVDPNHDYDNIPIGSPVPNSTSVVIGPMGSLVPWGAIGELCLMGPQLARGYWQREKQTKEKFVACPFKPDEKMYKTGDLVQWNHDGELIFLGRIDNQIKFRGYRIELDEIENRINDFPGVQASAVILTKKSSVDYLAGYYVAKTTISSQILRDSLASHLPSYMIPLKLIQIEKMPMTMNGKIDHRRLEEYANDETTVVKYKESPVGVKESQLFDLVKDLLGTDNFGVTDDLTQLGLSSLDAIRLSAIARKKGIALKVNDIMHGKTIRNIVRIDSIGMWQDGYHADKPVVVAVQGFSPYHVHHYFDALCEKYSVFTFSSLDGFLNETSKHYTKSDIVNRYLDLLESVLPVGICPVAFTGHCYGGELAYICAARWHERTGQTPKVILLNSPIRTEEELRQMIPSQKVIDQMADVQLQHFNDFLREQKMVLSLVDDNQLPLYQGEVIYYKAVLPYLEANKLTVDRENLERQAALYLHRWHSLAPNLVVVPISADHFSMLEIRYANLYIDKI